MPNETMEEGSGYGESPGAIEDEQEVETSPEEKAAEQTALLPKSLFKGEAKPGETVTLKVEAIYDDEVECSIVSEPEETESAPMTADEEIEAAGTEME